MLSWVGEKTVWLEKPVCFEMTNRNVFLTFTFAHLIAGGNFVRLSVPIRTTHWTGIFQACQGWHSWLSRGWLGLSLRVLVLMFGSASAPDVPHCLLASKYRPVFLPLPPVPGPAWIIATALRAVQDGPSPLPLWTCTPLLNYYQGSHFLSCCLQYLLMAGLYQWQSKGGHNSISEKKH